MGSVFQMALGRKECTTYTFRCSYELPFDPKGGAGKASKRKSVPMTAARLQKLASNLFLYTGDALCMQGEESSCLDSDADDDVTDGSCDVVMTGMTTFMAAGDDMTTGGTWDGRPGAALRVRRSE